MTRSRRQNPNFSRRTTACLCLVLLALQPVTAADAAERLVVLSNDEVVGTLDWERQGDEVKVTYRVDNNGRGPKVDEHIVLDDQGFPRSWTIRGSSLFGATVDESYRWQAGEASWRSQADQGTVAADRPPMYVDADGSPWSLGLYARALLATPERQLDVLPSGRMHLNTLDTLELGDDALPVTLYELTGLQLEPQVIALDEQGDLFASFGERGGLVRTGYEQELATLNAWARAWEGRRHRELQASLVHRITAPTRYRQVRIFDPVSASTGAPVSVLVRNGRIAAIDADPGAGDEATEAIIDGEGGVLVPGLYDMHSHIDRDSALFYLAAGVTSVRDMGNDNAVLAGLREASKQGELAVPRITPAGMIEARSPYSVRLGVVAESLDQALEAVRWYAANGYHEIKTYNSMKPEWVTPLVAEARAQGLGVTGHVPAFVHPDDIIEAGYDSIAHINQLMLGWLLEEGEDTRTPLRLTAMKRGADLDLDNPRVLHSVALMQEHGTAQDTTAVILERLMLSRAGEIQPGDRPYLSHMPIGYQRYRSRTFVPLKDPGDDAAYRAGFDRILDVIALLHESGITLLPGTDDGTGFTLHRELELYVAAGIPAGETLAMATLGAAGYLDQASDLGSIAPGKHADFFLLDRDPVEDISAVREIRLVSRGGDLYVPEAIYRALGIAPFAPGIDIALPETVTP